MPSSVLMIDQTFFLLKCHCLWSFWAGVVNFVVFVCNWAQSTSRERWTWESSSSHRHPTHLHFTHLYLNPDKLLTWIEPGSPLFPQTNLIIASKSTNFTNHKDILGYFCPLRMSLYHTGQPWCCFLDKSFSMMTLCPWLSNELQWVISLTFQWTFPSDSCFSWGAY